MLEIVDSLNTPARIKVFGVGGGGSNAVNRMIQAGLSGVEFWVANTDMQALHKSSSSNRLQIGCTVTRGLGAGGDPEIGRLSAQEDREAIAEILRGTDMLFVTAGMGGGTGTGAAPVVAEIAREQGILTVAIVTKPFAFEGKKKMARAQAGLAELGRNVDTLIAIPNQKLLNIVEPGTPFLAAMLVADEVLFQATRGISDLITGHGEINLDFADVKTVMRNRGNALLGSGVASGKDRAVEAAQAAVSSPLLEEVSIFGAEALLINVQGGPGMGLHEAAEAAQFVSDRVGEDADVFWGAVVDPNLDEEMRVTLIATGFPRVESKGDIKEAASISVLRRVEAVVEARPAFEPKIVPEPQRVPEQREPLDIVYASTPMRGDDEGTESGGNDFLSASWAYDRLTESEIFLPVEQPAPAPSYLRPSPVREKWEPAAPAGSLLSNQNSRSSGSFVQRLDPGLESRIGRRSPLDEPAFMRKRMD
jgi:cell division protein FtsZ